jgi:hypothetical protein|tara:strand:+ start:833 stop:1021 length:189 start_codon:yes stop_codon:yes gene_type:complete
MEPGLQDKLITMQPDVKLTSLADALSEVAELTKSGSIDEVLDAMTKIAPIQPHLTSALNKKP